MEYTFLTNYLKNYKNQLIINNNNSYSPADYYKTLTGETTYYKTLIGIPKYTINDDKIIPTLTKSNTTLIPE